MEGGAAVHWENERTGRIGGIDHRELKRDEEKRSLIATMIFFHCTFPFKVFFGALLCFQLLQEKG